MSLRRFCPHTKMTAATSLRFTATAFSNVPMGPADPILGLSVAFKADPSPDKVNLGVGVYRGDDGKPFVLECVKKAEHRLLAMDHEYAAITGVPGFVSAAQKLAFSEASAALKDKRIASTQTLSGTGALRVAGNFVDRWYKGSKTLLLPDPSWGNHTPVFKDSGLEVGKYAYYDKASKGISIGRMIEDLRKAPEGTMALFHACAHNPTGMDPTQDEWRQIADVVKERSLLPIVDMAYQGFASGDPDRDAFALRLFADKCPTLLLCQSFAKSFGLYGQRTGAMHIVCPDAETAAKVESQVKILIRPMYSNPPLHGARLAEAIFTDPELHALWLTELKQMANRMNGVRRELVANLKKEGSALDWSHIERQIGMMAFTGLSKEQVARLKAEFHVYMTDDGRAAVTGLNTGNVAYVAKAFHEVSK